MAFRSLTLLALRLVELHGDRNGFEYDVTMVDHDYKAKPVPADDGRIETAVTRGASGAKTHDECGIGE